MWVSIALASLLLRQAVVVVPVRGAAPVCAVETLSAAVLVLGVDPVAVPVVLALPLAYPSLLQVKGCGRSPRPLRQML
jgi:hypothetical protein